MVLLLPFIIPVSAIETWLSNGCCTATSSCPLLILLPRLPDESNSFDAYLEGGCEFLGVVKRELHREAAGDPSLEAAIPREIATRCAMSRETGFLAGMWEMCIKTIEKQYNVS